MGLSNGLSCETGSFSCCCLNPQVFSVRDLRLYFPALEPWVAQSVSLPSCSSQFICMRVWDLLIYQPPTCCKSSPPGCHSPPPSIGLDECFFFNSLVVRLPYSLIFCHFWLYLFLNLLLSFFWLCEEAKSIYLCLHLGQKSD